MANDRLYIVDKQTREYLCIAKSFNFDWQCGNVDLYADFINGKNYYSELIIGREEDDKFYNTYIKEGINFNKSNNWKSYET